MNSDPDTSTSLTASMKLPCKPFFRVCCELSGSHQQVSSARGGTIHPTLMVPPAKPREIARYAVSINIMLPFRGRQVRGKLNGWTPGYGVSRCIIAFIVTFPAPFGSLDTWGILCTSAFIFYHDFTLSEEIFSWVWLNHIKAHKTQVKGGVPHREVIQSDMAPRQTFWYKSPGTY